MGDGWAEYDVWNAAVADVLFPEDAAGQPVYMDLEDDTLEAIALAAGSEVGDPAKALGEAVRSTLELEPVGVGVFFEHLVRLRRWRTKSAEMGNSIDPPPTLALLAVTVMAAEDMGTGDVASHAYYPHLAQHLGVTTSERLQRLTIAYQQKAETLWGSVNTWLEKLEGRRGLPTAYSLSHRYIGLPMSQALVRDADRSKFPRMFESFGLPPGYQIAPGEMVPLFDMWVAEQPCPVSASLRKLWDRKDARSRIAEVVALELQTWDGTVGLGEGQGGMREGSAALMAMVRSRLGRVRLETSLAVRMPGAVPPFVLTLDTAGGDQADVSFAPAPGGYLVLEHTTAIDLGSLIVGELRLREPTTGTTAVRRPRRVIPMRFDEAQAAYVETERVQLGEDALVLVQDQGGLADKVDALLRAASRPGYEKYSADVAGVPDGWILFAGVQIMAAPPDDLARTLNELVPLVSAQLSVGGGLKLPGKIRKWSSLRPPEIRAVSQNTPTVRVTLASLQIDEESPVSFEWESSTAAIIVPLGDLELPDGDYRISLFEDKAKAPTQQAELRLRSSSSVDPLSWHHRPRLRHCLGAGPFATLTATESGDCAGAIVEGPSTIGSSPQSVKPVPAPTKAWWTARDNDQSKAPALKVAVADPKSCIFSGAHHLEFPTFYGKVTGKYIDGICKYCGLVKRQPAWAPRNKSSRSHAGVAPPIDVRQLEPRGNDNAVDWDAALDAAMHVGGGAVDSLERIALQVDGSQLFVDGFVRGLEATGNIEVNRDGHLRPSTWMMVPPYICALATGDYSLLGYWSSESRDLMADQAAALGGRLDRQADSEGPARWVLSGVPPSDVTTVAQALGATLVVDPTMKMLQTLPTMRELGASLTRMPLPGARVIKAFDIGSASWVAATTTHAPGAYRLESGYSRQDIFRNVADVNTMTAAVGTVQLVKHLAANAAGTVLVAYVESSRKLVVPLGADLPGLYGRALVLGSGRLPTVSDKTTSTGRVRWLVYHDVSREAANLMTALLLS